MIISFSENEFWLEAAYKQQTSICLKAQILLRKPAKLHINLDKNMNNYPLSSQILDHENISNNLPKCW